MPGGANVPAAVIATWPVASAHPVTQGPTVVIVCSLLSFFAAMTVAARVRSRWLLQRNAGGDDWVFVASVPFTLAQVIGVCLAVELYGYNKHVWDMSFEDPKSMRLILTSNCLNYVIATTLLKISVLLFYTRITNSLSTRWWTRSLHTFIIVEILYMIACIGTLCFGCRPYSSYWLRLNPTWASSHEYKCLPEGITLLVMAFISVLQDFIVTVVPMRLCWKLALPRRQKIALCCTFGMGLIVCGAGGARGAMVYRVYYQTYDTTWAAYYYYLACSVEVLLATICASAPALKYYFRCYLDGSPGGNNTTSTDSTTMHNVHMLKAGGTCTTGETDLTTTTRNGSIASFLSTPFWASGTAGFAFGSEKNIEVEVAEVGPRTRLLSFAGSLLQRRRSSGLPSEGGSQPRHLSLVGFLDRRRSSATRSPLSTDAFLSSHAEEASNCERGALEAGAGAYVMRPLLVRSEQEEIKRGVHLRRASQAGVLDNPDLIPWRDAQVMQLVQEGIVSPMALEFDVTKSPTRPDELHIHPWSSVDSV